MKKEELLTRIEKKEQAIAKIEKRIAKWTKGLSQEAIEIAKEYGLDNHEWQTQTRKDLYAKYKTYKEAHSVECFNQDDWNKGPNLDETMRAYADLRDAQITIEKYRNALQVELAKENELENNKIDTIWNFLLAYKERVKEYVRDNLYWVIEYHRLDHISCDLHNNGWSHTHIENGKRVYDDEYAKQVEEISNLEKQAKANIHPLTALCVKRDYSHYEKDSKVDYYINEEMLEEELTKDITSKYFKLIEQITKYTGLIQDAKGLSVGNKGDLNGVVIGEKGKARVETIGAGGYNNNIILDSGRHGQCFHFRTIVNPVK